jgi:protein TonB
MEIKKSRNANIEKQRTPILMIALLFVGGLVLASFSYTSTLEKDFRQVAAQRATEIVFTAENKEVDKPETNTDDVVRLPEERIIIDSNTQIIPKPVVTPPLPPVIPGPPVVLPPAEIIDFPDVEATFPGGAAEMQKWINSNVQYPQTSIEMNEQGRVYLSFIIESDGTVTGLTVERGVSDELDREAKRVVRKMPKWNAGEVAGKKVRTRCRLPIIFTLE